MPGVRNIFELKQLNLNKESNCNASDIEHSKDNIFPYSTLKGTIYSRTRRILKGI
jgi:hypothetical protein